MRSWSWTSSLVAKLSIVGNTTALEFEKHKLVRSLMSQRIYWLQGSSLQRLVAYGCGSNEDRQ
jgi:hypothetical protein